MQEKDFTTEAEAGKEERTETGKLGEDTTYREEIMRGKMVRKKDQKNLISEKGKGSQIERVEHGAHGGEEEMM